MESAFDEGCLFCRIVAGRVPANVVRDTEDFLSFRDIRPQAPTHVLVIPKAHGYRDAAELALHAPELAARLLAEGAEVAREEGLTDNDNVPGYRFVFNTGDAAGQTVYHVHLHVLGGDALGQFGSAPQ
ncbi:MAG: histidine triad nucleotide-binding protein [Actinocrinis sp.]